ncbi:serine/threonine-protein kinase [Streptomyces sp. NBC_01190]|uniref:serine/threonine-protein kinase n=1 Tax=Streptomyces sp. NBC_01190 TaxID=2903767 RepID=UPI0038649093|nr:serine/threonine protein kinase [Streptomyces sp. NBC_01190]
MDELRADDPRWIGEYRLLGRLGTGGMGRVYLARSQRGRTVAVKLVRAELAAQEEFRSRFRREVLAARRVGGAWTAPVLDADTEAEVPWVATGYVAGPSLQEVVGTGYGPLPERSVRVLARGLALALADIHGAGLIHRDLKPSNVMITIDGPRVIDFGIARALETVADGGALTHTGAMVGSPAFMSPEQVRGDRVTPACDIFCLGSVLAYAATGLQPFGAAASGVHAQMFRIAQEPPDLTGVPEGLRALVTACLTKEPAARPSLAEVRELLGEAPEAGAAAEAGAAHESEARDAAADEAAGVRRGAAADEPWLPGAIVAQVGRQVVRLLELEAAETGSLPVLPPEAGDRAGANGAVGAVGAGRGGIPSTDADGTSADPAYTPTYVSPVSPLSARPIEPEPPEADPDPDPDPRAGSGVRKGRRWTLVAVLALLAVIAGGATAFVAVYEGRPGDTDRTGSSGPPSPGLAPVAPVATAATGSATPSQTPSQTSDGAVPPAMIGTWHTTFADDRGERSARTLTVRPDGSVELLGDGWGSGGQAFSCTWTMRVSTVGPPVTLSPSQVTSGPPATCAAGQASTLTMVDSTHLRRVSVNGAQLTYQKSG